MSISSPWEIRHQGVLLNTTGRIVLQIRVSLAEVVTVEIEGLTGGGGVRQKVLDGLEEKGYTKDGKGWKVGVLPEGCVDVMLAAPIQTDTELEHILRGGSPDSSILRARLALIPPPSTTRTDTDFTYPTPPSTLRPPAPSALTRRRSRINSDNRPTPLAIAQNLATFFPGIDEIEVTSLKSPDSPTSASAAKDITAARRYTAMDDTSSIESSNSANSNKSGSTPTTPQGQQQMTVIARSEKAAKRLSVMDGRRIAMHVSPTTLPRRLTGRMTTDGKGGDADAGISSGTIFEDFQSVGSGGTNTSPSSKSVPLVDIVKAVVHSSHREMSALTRRPSTAWALSRRGTLGGAAALASHSKLATPAFNSPLRNATTSTEELDESDVELGSTLTTGLGAPPA
ncbi:hypothetical protein HK104_002867, partial [Borealophlyctis nickersoniae]